jgi:MFS family permease
MKFAILLFLLVLGPIAAGIYGALQDQIAYTVSPEFFTKFRFPIFNIADDTNPRWGAAIVGFKNSWQVGLLLGGILSVVGMIHYDWFKMVKHTSAAFLIAIMVAFIFSLIGLAMGAGESEISSTLNIIDKGHFLAVERMNNFSKMGGVIGMLIGLFYHVYCRNKDKVLPDTSTTGLSEDLR